MPENSGRVQAQKSTIKKLYVNGLSPNLIAAALGCGSKAVIRLLKAEGIYKNPREKKNGL